MATMIDLAVQRLLSEGYQMAKTVLSEHYDQGGKNADVHKTQRCVVIDDRFTLRVY